MATQIDDLIEDEPDLDAADDQNEDGEGRAPDDHDDEDGEGKPSGDAPDDEEDIITFGGEAARSEDDPPAIRNMRNRIKELEHENRSLKGAPAAQALPDKPTLEACGFDDDEYERQLTDYLARKREHEDREREQEAAARRAQERWEVQNRTFEDGWAALRIAGKDAARAKVESAFDATQQALLVKAARGNAAGLIYVLGSNPERLKTLADLKHDPAEFIAEAAVLAKEVQVTKRKPTTQPEQVHRGSPGGGGARSDGKLERLEKEADRTGDRTALLKYRRQLRDRGRA